MTTDNATYTLTNEILTAMNNKSKAEAYSVIQKKHWGLNIYYFTNIYTNKLYKVNTEITATCFSVNTPSSGSLQVV